MWLPQLRTPASSNLMGFMQRDPSWNSSAEVSKMARNQSGNAPLQFRRNGKDKKKKSVRLILWMWVTVCLLSTISNLAFHHSLSKKIIGHSSSFESFGFVSLPSVYHNSNDTNQPNASNKAQYFQSLYSNLPPSNPTSPSFQPVPYAYKRSNPIPYNYITLTTQLSIDKFDRLINLLDRYNGPVSATVYLTNQESILKLEQIVHVQSPKFRDLVTIHVLLERPSEEMLANPAKYYPANALRNLALFNIETEHFMILDVDFQTSQNAHDYLYNFFLYNKSEQRFTTLHVLPAFEVNAQEKGHGSQHFQVENVPSTKEELVSKYKKNQARVFHHFHRRGHQATNSDKWIKCGFNVQYPVEYQYMYEPYVVGMTHSIHRFDERFRGFGWNRVSWVNEANLRGYHFNVLCDLFVVHVNHPNKRNADEHGHDWTQHTQKLGVWYEQTYWPARYKQKWAEEEWDKEYKSKSDGILEYENYISSKQKYGSMCHSHVTSTGCLELAATFIESAITWSLTGGFAANDVLELDERLAILIEAEESALPFLSLFDGSNNEHQSFQHLFAKLYINLGMVERDRHATSQATYFFENAMDLGDDSDRERARTLSLTAI